MTISPSPGFVGVDRSASRTESRLGSDRVDVVIPVYNEQRLLDTSVRRLHRFLSRADFPHDWRIVIADNASGDDTLAVARALAAELDHVEVIHLAQKGRGRALRRAWLSSDAAVLAYMDADLSTDLRALAPLLAPLFTGHSEVAIGTRLAHGSRVRRGAKREFISRSYNRLLRFGLRARFSDAQCGFKALTGDAARELVPAVADQGWFFDTELLIGAQRRGMRIHEVPVDWVDDTDSSVDIVDTALTDLRGVVRLRFAGQPPMGLARTAGSAVAGTGRHCPNPDI
jgi:glycosyltransferase involved in cell wall biosynthesis